MKLVTLKISDLESPGLHRNSECRHEFSTLDNEQKPISRHVLDPACYTIMGVDSPATFEVRCFLLWVLFVACSSFSLLCIEMIYHNIVYIAMKELQRHIITFTSIPKFSLLFYLGCTKVMPRLQITIRRYQDVNIPGICQRLDPNYDYYIRYVYWWVLASVWSDVIWLMITGQIHS